MSPISVRHSARTLCFLLASLTVLSAQNVPKASPAKGGGIDSTAEAVSSVEDTLPVVRLEFAEPKIVPNTISAPDIVLPVDCLSDGTVIVAQLIPPAFNDIGITVALASKPEGAISIDKSRVPGFAHLQFWRYSATKQEIVVLAEGTKAQNSFSGDAPPPYSKFLLIFDRDGNFTKAILLDIPFEPVRFGVLKSGNFVVTGFDRTNNLPKVAIVGRDGTVIHFLDMNLETHSQVQDAYAKALGGHADDLVTSLGMQQMLPYGDNILLISSRTDLPVLEISDAGVIRSTVIQKPKNARIESFIPSDTGRWMIRMSRGASDANREYFLFEADPESGELLRRFEMKTPSTFNAFACASPNSFTAFRIDSPDKKPQLMLMTASY